MFLFDAGGLIFCQMLLLELCYGFFTYEINVYYTNCQIWEKGVLIKLVLDDRTYTYICFKL